MHEEPTPPVSESNDASGDTQKSDDKVPVALEEVSKVDFEENASASNTNKKKRKRKPLSCFEIWTVILGGVGIFVAACTGIAIYCQVRIGSKTLVEMQKSNKLVEEQLKGTQAALVLPYEPWTMDTQGHFAVIFNFKNDGHVIANEVHVTFTAQRERLIDLRPIGQPWQCDHTFPPMAPGAPDGLSMQYRCFLDGLGDNWQAIIRPEETIAINGSFSYQDSFGDHKPETLCYRYLAPFTTTFGQREGSDNFIDCETFKLRLENWRDVEKAKNTKSN